MILAEDLAIMDWNSNMNLAENNGESKVFEMFNWLHSQNRDEDFKKAASDPAYRAKLIEEYERNS